MESPAGHRLPGGEHPNPEGDAIRAIERYIVMPGQATVYKIGMVHVLALREQAHERLGDAFGLTGFHRAMLGHGLVPISIIEERIDAWAQELSDTPEAKSRLRPSYCGS